MSDLKSQTDLGLRIVRNGELDTNTPQTPGMTRAREDETDTVGSDPFHSKAP